jgi:predicted nucleic acid-binding protein
MAELLTTHSSLRLQTVDACVIALAERLDLHEVAALDRRDFQVGRATPSTQGTAAQAAT